MLVRTFAAPTVNRGDRALMIEKSTNSSRVCRSDAVYPQRDVRSPERRQMGLEKSGNASDKGRPVRPRVGDPRPSRQERPATRALHPAPELVELGETILRLVARDDAG